MIPFTEHTRAHYEILLIFYLWIIVYVRGLKMFEIPIRFLAIFLSFMHPELNQIYDDKNVYMKNGVIVYNITIASLISFDWCGSRLHCVALFSYTKVGSTKNYLILGTFTKSINFSNCKLQIFAYAMDSCYCFIFKIE